MLSLQQEYYRELMLYFKFMKIPLIPSWEFKMVTGIKLKHKLLVKLSFFF